MKVIENIVKNASEYITELLTKSLPSECTYHNLIHTLQVVDAVDEIGKNSGLTEDQLEVLHLSAWFHDTGFVRGYEGHEGKSIEIADEFLKENDYPPDKIAMINKTISVTDMKKKPVDSLEKIIRDADILHIGKGKFYENSFLLKREWEIIRGKKYTETEWIKSSLDFVTKTEFYTNYAKSRYEEGRHKNISYLKSMLK